MPSEGAITDFTRELLDELPSWVRDDPDMRAVIYCYAMESERVEEMAAAVRDALIPSISGSTLGLDWWEALFKISGVGEVEAVRRQRVLDAFLRMIASPSGLAWEEAVTAVLGDGWGYGTPDDYVIVIESPYEAGSEPALRLLALIRQFTPAHIEIQGLSIPHFQLDTHQLDQDQFHPE